MDFSKLLDGFVKIDTWISPSCYMDFSGLLHGFVKVVTWICQSCSMYFSHFTKQNRNQSRSLTEISKLVEASALN